MCSRVRENFVDYGGFTYNRGSTFIGSVTWLDVAALTWHVTPTLDAVTWTNLTSTEGLDAYAVNHRTLTGVTAFAQMADDARAVIAYLHENEVILPGFYMDPVLTDTTQAQVDAITLPAVQLTAPGQVFQTLPFRASGSLYNPWGGELIDTARVRVTIHAAEALEAADVAVTTADGDLPLTAQGGDLVGWWGPEAGFAMARGYRVSTDFDVTVGGSAPTGAYAVRLQLVDIDDVNTELAADEAAITVNANATTVLWGADIPSLGTQGSYVTVPVRVYAPTGQDAVLTFALTGPGDDPTTDVLEQLTAGDAKLFASNGLDMAPMPLSLTGTDLLTGTWPVTLSQGYTDVVWYLLVADGAPVGSYGIDAGIESGTDIAEPQYVSFAAPADHADHGSKPPDVGEDTTAPVVTITVDALLADSATFSFTANEEGVSFDCRLTSNGVVGDWEDCDTGTVTYPDLVPGAYTFAVTGTDAADNAATYVKAFVIDPDTALLGGPGELDFVLGTEATFLLSSTAEGATYDVAVNGESRAACPTDECVVGGLRTGLNTIEFAAVTDVSTDPEPAVRTVMVPIGAADLTQSKGWRMREHPAALFDTFAVTKRVNRSLSVDAPTIKAVVLVVTEAPRSGEVDVYLDDTKLNATPISLAGPKYVRGKLITVATFPTATSGTVRVVVASSGKSVRIEGIGIAEK